MYIAINSNVKCLKKLTDIRNTAKSVSRNALQFAYVQTNMDDEDNHLKNEHKIKYLAFV